jgi:hypothetical protein
MAGDNLEIKWGFPPYDALAAELNFGNECTSECGSLSQWKRPG